MQSFKIKLHFSSVEDIQLRTNATGISSFKTQVLAIAKFISLRKLMYDCYWTFNFRDIEIFLRNERVLSRGRNVLCSPSHSFLRLFFALRYHPTENNAMCS